MWRYFDSVATTVEEKKVNLPSKVQNTQKKSNKSVHFYHRGLA